MGKRTDMQVGVAEVIDRAAGAFLKKDRGKARTGRILVIIIAGLFLLNTGRSPAQESDLGNWLIYFGNVRLNSDWNWHHEVQYRNYDLVGDLEQLLLRTGFGYNLTENNNNVLVGYGYIRSENYVADTDEKTGINEHRIFQQFITRQTYGRVTLLHRYRFEQRFLSADFKMRLRYFLLLNVPVTSPRMEDNTLYLAAYNEIFLNAESPIFDRNRVYGGAGFRFNPKVRIEVGYLVQLFEKTQRDQLNMIVFLNL